MTTRRQKRKAVAELASVEFEVFTAQNNQTESYVAGPSLSSNVQPEKLDLEIRLGSLWGKISCPV